MRIAGGAMQTTAEVVGEISRRERQRASVKVENAKGGEMRLK